MKRPLKPIKIGIVMKPVARGDSMYAAARKRLPAVHQHWKLLRAAPIGDENNNGGEMLARIIMVNELVTPGNLGGSAVTCHHGNMLYGRDHELFAYSRM